MAGLEIASACICASIPVFWGPMLGTASQLLGQIFVTKEVHVTTEHRFEDLESNDTLHLRTRGTMMGMEERAQLGDRTPRLEWISKDGAVHEHAKSWSR